MSSVLLALSLTGCAIEPRAGGRDRSLSDIQERLSVAISHNGFTHSLRSERDGSRHVDSIYISVPLDSLKRRHYSLENLVKDVGRICSLPEYAGDPILIIVGVGDAEDRSYLKDEFLKVLGQRPNIRVSVDSDGYNDILITVRHPGAKIR
jgi:hypothetical protein